MSVRANKWLRAALFQAPKSSTPFTVSERILISSKSGLAWSNILPMTPMEESGPLSQVEACCGSPDAHRDDLYNLFRNACLVDESFDSFAVTQAPSESLHVGLHQQVLQHGEFERFFHQKSQKICKPLLCDQEGVTQITGKL